MWRPLAHCLPTLSLLQQRHVPVSAVSPACANDVESCFHALVGCQFARECWSVTNINVQFDQNQYFSEWLEGEIRRRSKDERALIVSICWVIWRARNDKVRNNKIGWLTV